MSIVTASHPGLMMTGQAAFVENIRQTPPNANNITLEMRAREGYEVKAIQSATRGFGFVLLAQDSWPSRPQVDLLLKRHTQ